MNQLFGLEKSRKDNKVAASVSLSSTHLNKIFADYDTLIEVCVQNKDEMSLEAITAYLKQSE